MIKFRFKQTDLSINPRENKFVNSYREVEQEWEAIDYSEYSIKHNEAIAYYEKRVMDFCEHSHELYHVKYKYTFALESVNYEGKVEQFRFMILTNL